MSLKMSGNDEHGQLAEQLAVAERRIRELELQLNSKTSTELPATKPLSMDSGLDVATIQEGDVTLRRLVQRIAMILQAEKICIMFFDRERGELLGIPPAFGVDDEKLDLFRVRATHGVSGQVFREGEPIIFHDATADPRTKKDMVSLLHVHNGITVPLVIERRDEENRVTDRTTIGVLHAFNKRHGEDFNDEDVRLLERMARNVGSIIANLQLYKEVVEEREELLQTFESLASGIILVSPEGKVSQVNAAARAMFGTSAALIGKPYTDLVREDSITKLIESGLRGESPDPIEINYHAAGSERILTAQVTEVKSDDGRLLGLVGVLNDVTEQRNVERMKSSFVAMASHELRTPLTAIKGFVSTLLMDDDFSNDERREFHQIIDQECDRLTRLINDLLNTARIEANESLKPNYKRFNVQNLVDKVLTIQRQASQKHNIFAKCDRPLPEIIGDEDKVDQILTNIINNAIKYSPDGGDIILHGYFDDDWVTMGVEDSGMGIAPDQLNKVFEKFHRVNNEDNRRIYGTGLGLFLVKHLVEQIHLGKIWVESELGKGSTFWIKLPRALNIEKAKELNR